MKHKVNSGQAPGLLLVFVLLLSTQLPIRVTPERAPSEGNVYVEARGTVRWPGVYAFVKDPTLEELLKRSGGSSLVLPRELLEKKLGSGDAVILSMDNGSGSFEKGCISAHRKVTLGIPILLNSASVDELSAIPGIGVKTASIIVEERRRRGGTINLEELASLPGIGPNTFRKIERFLAQ